MGGAKKKKSRCEGREEASYRGQLKGKNTGRDDPWFISQSKLFRGGNAQQDRPTSDW